MKKSMLRVMALTLVLMLTMTSSGLALTLRYPQRGDDVASLQTALKQLGYYTGNVDGIFGKGTRTAVRGFQDAFQLTVDGVAGSQTLAKIEQLTGIEVGGDTSGDVPGGSGTENTPVSSGLFGGVYTTLQYGSSGERVKILQRALKALGFEVSVDGDFGSGTYTAVREFQKRTGLTVDGKAGKNTLRKLETFFDKDGNLISGPIVTDPPSEDENDGYAEPTRTLRYGMAGEDVRYTQQRLGALAYYTGVQNGQFDQATQTAVKAFQRNNGLTVDGVVGADTRKKLFSDSAIPADEEASKPSESPSEEPTPTPSAKPEATPSRTLRYGSSGDDVVLLQLRLIALGYLSDSADGKFGSQTLAAVKAFQKQHGLAVDGVAGSATYGILFSENAKPAGSATPPPSTPPSEEEVIPSRTLTIGDSGEEVRALQNRLIALDYLDGSADGEYGSATAAAVKAFQQMNGLTATGMGDLTTTARMFSSNALTAKGVQVGEAAPAYTTLRSGATGTQVIRLQQALAKYDYDVRVTGTYDAQTMQAVRSFQALNSLTVDGVAGKNTMTVLYSGSCKRFPTGPDGAIYGSMGYVAAPAKSKLQLLHWADELKTTLKHNEAFLAYDPATGISWSLTIIARGRHCDVEPSTAADTRAMHAAFGNKEDWGPKPVYIRLSDGRWTVATTHNVAHGVNPIPDNDFEGQNCVHFLRDMSEAELNDPNYGVDNQKVLRQFWYDLTGQTIPYK